MAEVAQPLSSKELQSQTLAFPVLADENGTKLDEADNKSMVSTGNTCTSMEGGIPCENSKITTDDSYLELENVINKTENDTAMDSEGCKCNTAMDSEAANELSEPLIGEFWGKYGENVDGEDDRYDHDDTKELLVQNKVFAESFRSSDDNGGSDFSENGLGKKVVDEQGNGFGGTKTGGENSEGFNGNIDQRGSDGKAVIGVQVVEKLVEPLYGEVLGKGAEDVVGEDYMCKDKINDKTGNDNGFGGTQNGRETGEGFNGNIIQCSGDGRVVLGDQEVEKLFKSSNEEFLGKGAENEVGKDYISDDDNEGLALKDKVIEENFQSSNGNGESDFPQDGSAKKVINENGISVVVKLPIDNNLGNCDGVELEKAGKEGESKDEEDVLYLVGDLVWSKFNSHPWWPAQIYDPSDASDHAKKYSHKGKKVLVAYFGDGSFSWRSPTQLKPFAENIDELSKQNDSLMFLTAVQSALDEIGRVAELKMICPCMPEANKAGLSKKAMVNAGIKEGVLGPDCDFSRVPFSDFEPTQLLLKLKSIAKANPVKSMLELTGLRSCLSAFYRSNGGRKLAFYHERAGIEGLEDETRNVSDHSVMQRCGGLFESKLNGTRKRKRKSVAKLMKEHNNVEPDTKKMKSIDKSPKSSKENVLSPKNDGDEIAPNNIGDSLLEEETEDMVGSRKRKKSRYLSYPYTDLKLNVEIFRSKRELEAESVKINKIARVGERMTTAAANLTHSPILKKKLSGKSNNGGDTSALSGSGSLEEAQKKLTEIANIEVSPEEVVNQIRSAALDPQKKFNPNTFDMVNNFISAYKRVVYKSRLGVEKLNENLDEMTMADFIRKKKKEIKKAKKNNDEWTDNEGLVFLKEKLKKMTLMVENCGGVMVLELKLSLEKEMKELLEKISSMVKPT